MKYKENQRVKLRGDLQVGEEYGCWYFSPGGETFIGKVVTLDEWQSYEDEGEKSKGFFTIKEQLDGHIPVYITYDMIDHEGSKYILRDGNSLAEVFAKVSNNEQQKVDGSKLSKEEKTKLKTHSDILENNKKKMPDEIELDILNDLIPDENIRPAHYRKGGDNFDLFEAAYRTRPFEEFRAIMEFVAERYLRRMKGSPEKRIEDLGKAIYTIERLKEKEIIELKKKNGTWSL